MQRGEQNELLISLFKKKTGSSRNCNCFNYYYFCVVENSLGDDTKTTKSNMIEVVVQEKTVEKTIEVNLPSKSGLYEITVYVDGVLQYGPASVSITDDRSVIVEVTVRGKGTLPVDVYLDGAIYDSQLILFE